ncbi:hypothetical protein, partial [Liquorilactobacillus sp.]|uniref:hypothetical protein n=1 Tax=Liquorilactobacillus sp. TaxID=2767923 RepID=UPI0039ED6B47
MIAGIMFTIIIGNNSFAGLYNFLANLCNFNEIDDDSFVAKESSFSLYIFNKWLNIAICFFKAFCVLISRNKYIKYMIVQIIALAN